MDSGANATDGARSDITAMSFWNPLCKAFFDVQVLNPLADSNRSQEIPQMYRSHEMTKKRQYNQRIIEIEHGTFTPLIFSCSGGSGIEANKCLKQLAHLICVKKKDEYSNTINFIRRRISFDILRTCILALRGYRKPVRNEPIAQMEYGLCNL